MMGTSLRSFHLLQVVDVRYLVHGSIDAVSLLDCVSENTRGGTVLFCGTVRAGPEDGPVTAIEYTAYEQMAESEFARIVSEAADRWPDVAVALEHRLGRVPIGEASIVIAAAAAHRAEAFDACRYVIDETKVRVPIWKREFLEDGDTRWRSNKETSMED
jgi:molybdopterin synthase catalytic subunit